MGHSDSIHFSGPVQASESIAPKIPVVKQRTAILYVLPEIKERPTAKVLKPKLLPWGYSPGRSSYTIAFQHFLENGWTDKHRKLTESGRKFLEDCRKALVNIFLTSQEEEEKAEEEKFSGGHINPEAIILEYLLQKKEGYVADAFHWACQYLDEKGNGTSFYRAVEKLVEGGWVQASKDFFTYRGRLRLTDEGRKAAELNRKFVARLSKCPLREVKVIEV